MTSTPRTFADSVTLAPPSHHHHLHLPGKRLRHFFRPNGRKVHIAGSPDEVETLRRTLSIIEKDGNFDLVIHGSPEHIDALKETHSHHEQAHKLLREQYGDILDEFERVIRDLDALSAELHMISDHAVQLDANFSKYGYSAHLRTKDSPPESSANSLYGDHSSAHDRDWDAERQQGQVMKFYSKPIVRQYFHKGLLWRAQEAQEAASYELFIDLLYVGIIAISGDNVAEEATGQALLRFAITFMLGWKFWSDISILISWFDSDDILRRFTVLFILTCLLGFTTNMAASWTDTYTPLISFYLASRLFIALSYAWHGYLSPIVRASMWSNAALTSLPGALWIASIHIEEPQRQGLIWTALMLDIFGYTLLVFFQRGGCWMGPKLQAWCKKIFEFYPGANIEHKIERTGAFVTLVFGYSVVGLLYENRVPFGINAYFGKAVLGLVQAFAFNWLYFEIDSFNLHTHAIRRHVFSSMIWMSIHLPFIMSFVLSAASLSKLVLAHDCPDSSPDTLFETYALRSAPDISSGQRWFYCAGLGIALASMGIISLTHVYKTIPNQRLLKEKRLVFRFAVAIIIICLPLVESLNSLQLIATTTGLVLFVLLQELAGSTCTQETFWWDNNKPCKYMARCKVTRKELEASMKNGTVINVEDIAKREGGEQGLEF
ncbi:hypothetical protein K432DRAFT_45747 [Lepidopterella palustris CBS 459.81]|uniref:Bacterial low temperature requirement A protein-domain-containing protein n=1 Tax=Lepidopterella palustris CBS 459.81 TaxID=1314670 RepID=A0A8E2JF54_9PEZI|nr:hypothetical protein K432DRAFT_45747 [Lepidopterella palustris CBS 459.81]